ncbi:hypothetical protein WCX49_02365 [Sulfurimonas sp. HSL-1656]|uniref:hypothetical protein n=1 Tax=Thiomicrolovo subterrani TaxID=3131934 RepID=UPI0031F91146
MFNKKALFRFLGAATLLSTLLHADGQTPLKVEELLSKKNAFNVDVSVAYSNIDQKTAMSTVVPVSTLLSFIYIPAYAGEQVLDQDVVVASLNLKYGLTDWLELVMYANGHNTSSRVQLGDAIANQADTDFDHAGIGATFRVKDEGVYPSLLVGVSTNVIGRLTFADRDVDGNVIGTTKQDKTFESFNFYALSYYTVDPVVFVFKAQYQWSVEEDYKGDTSDRPDILAISPQVYFAVNPYTNLSWGVTYRYQTEQRFNGKVETIAESSIGYNIGVSYEVSRGNIISLDASNNETATYSQNTINLIYSKRF